VGKWPPFPFFFRPVGTVTFRLLLLPGLPSIAFFFETLHSRVWITTPSSLSQLCVLVWIASIS